MRPEVVSKKTRIVKRYPNRKLYDTTASRYVTLQDIGEMICKGEDVKVIDNNSKEDLTSVTLTQIIFEQEKKKKNVLPLVTLRNIIQSGGEKVVDFVQSTIESGVSSISHVKDEAKEYLEKLVKIGENSPTEEAKNAIRNFIDTVTNLPILQTEIKGLRRKVELLEERLKKYEK